jgi:hypothetical protein
METIKCQICHKEIPNGELIYGQSGNYFCHKCFNPRPSDLKTTKKEAKINKKNWNRLAKESNYRFNKKLDGIYYHN